MQKVSELIRILQTFKPDDEISCCNCGEELVVMRSNRQYDMIPLR